MSAVSPRAHDGQVCGYSGFCLPGLPCRRTRSPGPLALGNFIYLPFLLRKPVRPTWLCLCLMPTAWSSCVKHPRWNDGTISWIPTALALLKELRAQVRLTKLPSSWRGAPCRQMQASSDGRSFNLSTEWPSDTSLWKDTRQRRSRVLCWSPASLQAVSLTHPQQILSNRIQQYIKKITHRDQVVQGFFSICTSVNVIQYTTLAN